MSDRSRLFARVGASLAAVSLGLVAIGVVASPAAAAGPALPTGSSLYALSCDEDIENLSLYSVDVGTAAAAPVGEAPAEVDSCAYGSAWDASTGIAYVVVDNNTLITVDPLTGDAVEVAGFTLEGDEVSVDTIAISPSGDAYGIDDDVLYSVDLTTAELTVIGLIREVPEEASTIYAFAVDPTTGELVGIDVSGVVYSIDPVTGMGTGIGKLDLSAGGDVVSYVYSLQIDAAGVYWLEIDAALPGSEIATFVSRLWSTNRATVSEPAALAGTLTVNGETPLLEALLLVPAPVVPVIPAVPVEPAVPAVVTPPVPTLANTGVDAVPLAAGGALVALLGLALLVPAIRRRATA